MKRTKEWLISAIKYEEHKGVHTYHTCSFCQVNATRSGKCAECLKKELKEVGNGN